MALTWAVPTGEGIRGRVTARELLNFRHLTSARKLNFISYAAFRSIVSKPGFVRLDLSDIEKNGTIHQHHVPAGAGVGPGPYTLGANVAQQSVYQGGTDHLRKIANPAPL